MENSPLTTLPPELIHHIFDYCDIRTILLSVRGVCQTLYAMVNTYDRLAITLNSKSAWTMKSVSRIVRSEQVISLTIADYDT
ncbi:unnamed protein product [Adineta ricciae]|uniref:F-box domain-containing protein n=1 Tax=Adineta ricciae TaxID=249248 RepID=A0A815NI50_ADIRI|nr:unnamed protein product [Adineta ricciae]